MFYAWFMEQCYTAYPVPGDLKKGANSKTLTMAYYIACRYLYAREFGKEKVLRELRYQKG